MPADRVTAEEVLADRESKAPLPDWRDDLRAEVAAKERAAEALEDVVAFLWEFMLSNNRAWIAAHMSEGLQAVLYEVMDGRTDFPPDTPAGPAAAGGPGDDPECECEGFRPDDGEDDPPAPAGGVQNDG